MQKDPHVKAIRDLNPGENVKNGQPAAIGLQNALVMGFFIVATVFVFNGFQVADAFVDDCIIRGLNRDRNLFKKTKGRDVIEVKKHPIVEKHFQVLWVLVVAGKMRNFGADFGGFFQIGGLYEAAIVF